MKLNEDNTVTLSLRETQRYVTKVINPEFKRLERLRKYDWVARQITDLDRRLNRIKTLQETLLECLNDKSTSSADLRNQIKNLTNEFNLNKNTTAAFIYQLNNCLLKFSSSSTNPDYQFKTDTEHYNQIILNENPKFYNVSQNKFNIDTTSPAFAKGNQAYIIPLDILGKTRTSPPDLGAYQSAVFPK